MDLSYLDGLSKEELIRVAEQGDMYAQIKLASEYSTMMYMMIALSGGGSNLSDFEDIVKEDSKLGLICSKYVYWATKACEHDSAEVKEVQHDLGCKYYDGFIVKKDRYKASQLFQKSAKHGYAPAQVLYAKCLINGDTAPKISADDFINRRGTAFEDSFQYYLSAASSGEFLIEDRERRAFEWIQKAAAQDYPEGLLYMGICYADGIGVRGNIEVAKEWWKKAAAKGNKDAKKILTEFGIYL